MMLLRITSWCCLLRCWRTRMSDTIRYERTRPCGTFPSDGNPLPTTSNSRHALSSAPPDMAPRKLWCKRVPFSEAFLGRLPPFRPSFPLPPLMHAADAQGRFTCTHTPTKHSITHDVLSVLKMCAVSWDTRHLTAARSGHVWCG